MVILTSSDGLRKGRGKMALWVVWWVPVVVVV
jgi:hypothetical protein